VVTVVPKIRRALYRDMFLIAKQNATLSKQAKQMGNNEEELRYSLVTVIMACCCLEAFINTYAMQKHWDECDSYAFMEIREKWLYTTREYSFDGTNFNKQSQPYSYFSYLVRLRNYFVHYKSKPTSPIQSGKGLISKQETKLTASTAARVIETTKRMIEEFHKFAGYPLPDWLES